MTTLSRKPIRAVLTIIPCFMQRFLLAPRRNRHDMRATFAWKRVEQTKRARQLHNAHRIDIDLPAGRVEDAQDLLQVVAAQDHLPAVLALQALHDSGRGSDDIGVFQVETLDPAIELFAQEQRLVLGAQAVLVAVGELHELAEWRVTIAAARLDLRGVEFVIVVARGSVDAEVLRIERLDNTLPG